MGRAFQMGKFVGVCVGLFVLAVGFVALTQGPQMADLIKVFRSEPALYQVAWGVIVLVPLLMLPFAVWLWDKLLRQRHAAKTLSLRLDGVRQGVQDLNDAQAEVEGSVEHLTLTDPEDAIAALKRRISEAERFAEIQRKRHEDKDLPTRVEAVRSLQQELRTRLAPVLDTRRSLEQVFLELDSQQSDIDRALSEIATGDDALALDLRLKKLTEFVRQSNARCDQIELASKTVVALNESCADLRLRLGPMAAAEGGVTSQLRELSEKSEKLSAEIEAIEQTPEGHLSGRIQQLADSKKKLDEDIARLDAQFTQLTTLQKDVSSLSGAFDRALAALSAGRGNDSPTSIEGRIEEVSRFIDRTHVQFDDIARRVVVFGQLKTRLGELESRLAPLESGEGGVVNLIEELQDIRERLIVKIRRIEGGEEGDLAARVKSFAESKRDLEERVSSLADQFTKLATVRRDIAGLFDKLSHAVNSSSS